MEKDTTKSKKTELYIGTKFIGHDSSLFIIDPVEKSCWGVSTERATRYKHDSLSPEDVFKLYKKNHKEKVKKVRNIHIGHSFRTVGLTLTKDNYFFHKNFRKHFNVYYKKDVERKIQEFNKLSVSRKFFKLATSINGISLILLFAINKIFGQKRVSVEDKIKRICKKTFPNAVVKFSVHDHETCHAISSHYTSPFQKQILFATDGFGDGDFSKVFIADKDNIKKIAESKYQEVEIKNREKVYKLVSSPGKIYSYFTTLLGFEENADEGKVEALAAYAKPIEKLLSELDKIYSINSENSLVANIQTIKSIFKQENIEEIFRTHTKEQIAATVQKFLENLTERYLTHINKIEKITALSLSGGVAANVINNLMIFEKICKNIHITPSFGDDGSAQGACIMSMLEDGFNYDTITWLRDKTPYYGTEYNVNIVKKIIKKINARTKKIKCEEIGEKWPEKAAEMIRDGKIGAIFHGRMEWGPRALGNRSIIADPTRAEFRDKINREIKRRPFFQPFCPSILDEERARLFDESYENKHMTCAFRMKKEFWDLLPSAIHVDGTARVQFVRKQDNEKYYRLINRFRELTGFGVIINTSFNKHGRTIVESPIDAITDFIDTDMDFLIIEGIMITRK